MLLNDLYTRIFTPQGETDTFRVAIKFGPLTGRHRRAHKYVVSCDLIFFHSIVIASCDIRSNDGNPSIPIHHSYYCLVAHVAMFDAKSYANGPYDIYEYHVAVLRSVVLCEAGNGIPLLTLVTTRKSIAAVC